MHGKNNMGIFFPEKKIQAEKPNGLLGLGENMLQQDLPQMQCNESERNANGKRSLSFYIIFKLQEMDEEKYRH